MIRFLFLFSALFFASNVVCAKKLTAQVNYSPAIVAGDFIFISGQFPIDPVTGRMIEGDIATLTNQTIDNIRSLLLSNGVDLNQIVNMMVYLKDIRDYEAMDQAYGQRFNFQG